MARDSVRRVYLPRPLEHQRPVLLSPARFPVLACGRRWGKSTVAISALIEGRGPTGREFRGALDGAACWIVVPNFGMASERWRELKDALRDCWDDKSEVEKRIALPGGGSISIRSGDDPDSLRGSGLDACVLDEAAFMSEAVWREAIRPALSDRNGWCMFTSTPDGQANWFFDLWTSAENSPGWERWQEPTSRNPLVPAAELAAAHREIGSYSFSQEYLAEFVSPGGGLFHREHARHYRLDRGAKAGNSHLETDEYVFRDDGSYCTASDMSRFITCDTATSTKTSADFTAIAVWGVDPRRRLCLLDLVLQKIEGPEIMRAVVAVCKKWETTAWIEENSTAKHLLSFMEQEGVPFRTVKPGSQDKWTRALPAAALWEQGRIMLPEAADWLPAFERQLYGFTGRAGGADDCVDCVAYAAKIMSEDFSCSPPQAPPRSGKSVLDRWPKGLLDIRAPEGFGFGSGSIRKTFPG